MRRILQKATALLLVLLFVSFTLFSCMPSAGYPTSATTVASNTCRHRYDGGVCIDCGESCIHTYQAGYCSRCGFPCAHAEGYVESVCVLCQANCQHKGGFKTGECADCGIPCTHEAYQNSRCTACGLICSKHVYENGDCMICDYICGHYSYKNGVCAYCKTSCAHENYVNGVCQVCKGKDENYTPFVLPLKKGVNLTALEGNTIDPSFLFDPFTYQNIKGQGFDHIRLPVDFRLFYNNFNVPESFVKITPEECWGYLDQIIALAEANELYIIIDFHGWYDIDISDKAQKELYLFCITELAERYKDASDYVIFELINEPHTTEGGNLDGKILEDFQREVVALLRQTNPTRILILATSEWNSPWTLDKLNVPDDPRIAVAVHTYATLEFTHQGCTWANPEYTKRVPLTDEIMAELEKHMNWILAYMKRSNVPVILNEFGLNTSWIAEEDIARYVGFIADFCEENGIPFTYWAYNGGFGIYKNGQWNQAFIQAVFKD